MVGSLKCANCHCMTFQCFFGRISFSAFSCASHISSPRVACILCRSRIKSRTTRILNSICTRLARHVLLQLIRRGWQRNWALNTSYSRSFSAETSRQGRWKGCPCDVWVWWIEHNLGQKGPSPNSQHPKYPRIWFPGPKKVGTRLCWTCFWRPPSWKRLAGLRTCCDRWFVVWDEWSEYFGGWEDR